MRKAQKKDLVRFAKEYKNFLKQNKRRKLKNRTSYKKVLSESLQLMGSYRDYIMGIARTVDEEMELNKYFLEKLEK